MCACSQSRRGALVFWTLYASLDDLNRAGAPAAPDRRAVTLQAGGLVPGAFCARTDAVPYVVQDRRWRLYRDFLLRGAEGIATGRTGADTRSERRRGCLLSVPARRSRQPRCAPSSRTG